MRERGMRNKKEQVRRRRESTKRDGRWEKAAARFPMRDKIPGSSFSVSTRDSIRRTRGSAIVLTCLSQILTQVRLSLATDLGKRDAFPRPSDYERWDETDHIIQSEKNTRKRGETWKCHVWVCTYGYRTWPENSPDTTDFFLLREHPLLPRFQVFIVPPNE